MDQFTLDISVPEAQFERHLALSENRRIIFSGPFGSGKTYFLNKFFEKKADKFTVVRLAPVNYSVAQNEDIFELIKFDILFHLLEKKLLPKKAEFSKTDILRQLWLLNPEKGLQGILEKANKTGSTTKELLETIEAVLNDPQNPFASTDNEVEIQPLIDFLTKIARTKGSINEYDAISKLIYYLISAIKTAKKEVVLVIDDLDRIDPEHIFRILNVFAAHFDLNGKENKFGFVRIILVCDVDNIRRVFATRYGQEVDFSGYIDKFHSQGVFQFDNSLALKNKISDVLQVVQVIVSPDAEPDNQGLFPIHRINHPFHRLVLYILEALIFVNATNLRSVRKVHNSIFEIENQTIGRVYDSIKFPIFWVLSFVKSILGNGISLRNGIEKCVFAKVGTVLYDPQDKENHQKMGLIIPATTIPYNMILKSYVLPNESLVEYDLIEPDFSHREYFAKINPVQTVHIDIFPALLEAIDVFQRMGHLK